MNNIESQLFSMRALFFNAGLPVGQFNAIIDAKSAPTRFARQQRLQQLTHNTKRSLAAIVANVFAQ